MPPSLPPAVAPPSCSPVPVADPPPGGPRCPGPFALRHPPQRAPQATASATPPELASHGAAHLPASRRCRVSNHLLTPPRRSTYTPMTKKRVGLLGATGIAGQQFIAALRRSSVVHAWPGIRGLGAVDRQDAAHRGATLTEAAGALRWYTPTSEPSPRRRRASWSLDPPDGAAHRRGPI